MDLSRRLLEDKEFPSNRKGYDQNAVDDFLERIGVAVEDLQGRLAEALQRVDHLEVVGGASSSTNKALALAQKAAREIRENAERDVENMRKSLAEEKKLFELEAEQLIVALEQQKMHIEAAQQKAASSGSAVDKKAEEVLAAAELAAEKIRKETEARAALELRDLARAREETMLLRDEAERYSNQTRRDVEALASDAEDLLTGAQQAAEDIMRDARKRAQDLARVSSSPAPSNDGSTMDQEAILAEAQAMREQAEERVQQATLLRDEAELLMTSAKSSAELARASAITEARKKIADERRQVRAQADGILGTAQREREVLLADTKKEVSDLLEQADNGLALIREATSDAQEELEQLLILLDEARDQADSIVSEAAVEAARTISDAKALAHDRADKVTDGMRGEVTELERARANLRFELVNLDGQIGAQQRLLSEALAEAEAIALPLSDDSEGLDSAHESENEKSTAADDTQPVQKKSRKRRRKR